MKVFIEREKKEIDIKFNGKLIDLYKKVGINKESVISMKDNELLIDEDSLKDSDNIKIISVVSGG